MTKQIIFIAPNSAKSGYDVMTDDGIMHFVSTDMAENHEGGPVVLGVNDSYPYEDNEQNEAVNFIGFEPAVEPTEPDEGGLTDYRKLVEAQTIVIAEQADRIRDLEAQLGRKMTPMPPDILGVKTAKIEDLPRLDQLQPHAPLNEEA